MKHMLGKLISLTLAALLCLPALALAEDRATDSCYRAADEAMSGVTNVGNCVFFRTPIPGLEGINIGGHVFY